MTNIADPARMDSLAREEFAALATVAAALFPPEPDGVGAVEAGALFYIDRLLVEDASHLVEIYRAGVMWLDTEAQRRAGVDFADLPRTAAEEIVGELMTRSESLTLMSGGPSSSYAGLTTPSEQAEEEPAIPVDPNAVSDEVSTEPATPVEVTFIALLWQHIREGLFADPRHGGNKEAMVWRWLGYNGPQLNGYTDSEILDNVIPKRPLRIAADWTGHHE